MNLRCPKAIAISHRTLAHAYKYRRVRRRPRTLLESIRGWRGCTRHSDLTHAHTHTHHIHSQCNAICAANQHTRTLGLFSTDHYYTHRITCARQIYILMTCTWGALNKNTRTPRVRSNIAGVQACMCVRVRLRVYVCV